MLTSSNAVTDEMSFTAHVGCSNVFGFSTAAGAPGTAEDTAPLSSTIAGHSTTANMSGMHLAWLTERGWGIQERKEARHRRNTVRMTCRNTRPGVRSVLSTDPSHVPGGVNRDHHIITEQMRMFPAHSSSTIRKQTPAWNSST